jgi:peptidoglycan/LPS O-acetylase OafA/YrhL
VHKLYNIQSLRGIAALLVVLSHLLIIELKYGGANSILPDLARFGVFGVDLFFVISGFIMVSITNGKFQSFKETTRFIYHRTIRIYPVYWFYSLLLLFVFLIHPEWINSSQGNQIDILSSFLLLPSQTLPLLAVGWTLIHEVYFYLVFTFILLFVNERNLIYALFIWGSGVIFFNLSLDSNSPIVMLVTHPLTLEFISGCLLALFYRKYNISMINAILVLLIGTTLVAAMYLFNSAIGANGLTPEGWDRPLILGVPAVLIVYFFLMAERNNLVLSKLFVLLGDASYSIYLTHILTFSLVGRVWGMFSADSVFDNFLMIPVMFVLACIFGVTSYFWLEKPIIKHSKRIIHSNGD